MADATPTATSKPTNLAFALGSLDATVKGQTEEQSRQREAIENLPQRMAEAFGPRFISLESSSKDHNARLIVLEGDKRFLRGAFWVIASAIVIVGGKAFVFK